MRRLRCSAGGLATGLALALVLAPATPAAAAPYGSGSFGRWHGDRYGLPVYRYAIDEERAPQAARPELVGLRSAWHQVGNDRLTADAFNHGYTQLWDQERLFQWANLYEPARHHYAGGYGYLHVRGGRTISTLYDDRPRGARVTRDFGSGYYARTTRSGRLAVAERVYAPFGDDPLLLHDVRIVNRSSRPLKASWFEYWDVNPAFPLPDKPARAGSGHVNRPVQQIHRAMDSPRWDPGARTLSVAQRPSGNVFVPLNLFATSAGQEAPEEALTPITGTDERPLTIFAAALAGPLGGYDTDVGAFFGSGGRARPQAVAADRASRSIAPPVTEQQDGGRTLFAMRAPVRVRPHGSVTLRYAYGIARPEAVAPLVARYRARPHPFDSSERAWARFVPQASFGKRFSWLARELRWQGYLLRSYAVYDDGCGHHVIDQGGYYQYGLTYQGSYRDPLMHALPMIYLDPWLARETILYSAQEQRAGTGQMPYAMYSLCRPLEIGTSADMDVWLLLATAEYVLATRDTGVLREPVRFADHDAATLWQHMKLAVHHQEDVVGRGPHGGYNAMQLGDWADFITQYQGMTESTIVPGQVAVAYRRLAQVADLTGDRAFAHRLRTLATGLERAVRAQWNGRWFVRGYAGDRKIGDGAIFGDMQPWAILSRSATRRQSASILRATRRFLTGVGAPLMLGRRPRIGSAQVPANDDPGVHEHYSSASSEPVFSVGGDNAGFVGGTWQVVNGWLVWAMSSLADRVPGAREFAFDEWRRNTLAAHAAAFPRA
ncbi:MAG: GH36-type glycosyl hydrolase domain-containing protein, partial [Thermoleophilaceae bacterium]